jgi:hypothetical protein
MMILVMILVTQSRPPTIIYPPFPVGDRRAECGKINLPRHFSIVSSGVGLVSSVSPLVRLSRVVLLSRFHVSRFRTFVLIVPITLHRLLTSALLVAFAGCAT